MAPPALIVAAALILWAGGTGTPSFAEDSVASTDEFVSARVALLEDLATMAAAHGISIQEAERRYELQSAFNEAAAVFEEENPDAFVASGFSSDGAPFLEVTSSGPTAAVNSLLGRFPTLQVGYDRPFSSAQLTAATEEIAMSIGAGLDLKSPMVVAPDPSRGVVDVYLNDDRDATVATTVLADTEYATIDGADYESVAGPEDQPLAGPQQAVPIQVMAAAGSGHPVVVLHVQEEMTAVSAALYGGDSLSGCTAGFPAQNVGTTQYGLASAGHCSDTMDYTGYDWLYTATNLAASSGDLQWQRGKVSVSNQFRYDWNKYRVVSTNGTIGQWTDVCKFGKVSGRTCAQVYGQNRCVKYLDYPETYCKMAFATNRMGVQKGDSGGPWYSGSTAYGITSGWHLFVVNGVPTTVAVFTPTKTSFTAMHIKLKTS